MVKPFLAIVSAALATMLAVCPLQYTAAATTTTTALATATQKRELTPADAIGTTRIIENQLTLGERVETGTPSPDGRRYVLRLVHGDVERNGDWMDLLTGGLNCRARFMADSGPL